MRDPLEIAHMRIRGTFPGASVAVVLLTLTVGASAQTTTPTTASTDPATTTQSTPALSIEVQSSRRLTAGEGLGVSATIRNVSGQVVYIRERDLTLTLPLELEGARSEVTGYPAFFPTEVHDTTKRYPEYFENVVAIAPGDAYNAFWARTNTSPSTSGLVYIYQAIASQVQYLFFRPDDYRLEITGKYWTDSTLPSQTYRTATTNVTVPVAAPQFVIFFGAALGGLLAYFILTPAPRAQSKAGERTLRVLGALGAMSWSVLVTILISRLAETQFVISVTINDLWGAVAIGFVGNYAGGRLLERIRPPDDTDNDTQQDEKKLTVS
jgi:hypothetical protein